MEWIIEFIGELIIEGIIELATNRRIPRWIRYPAFVLVALFFIAIIGGLFYLGAKLSSETLIGSLLCFGIATLFLTLTLRKLWKRFRNK